MYVYNCCSQPIIRSGIENPDEIFSRWPKLKKIFFTCGRYVYYMCRESYLIKNSEIVEIANDGSMQF